MLLSQGILSRPTPSVSASSLLFGVRRRYDLLSHWMVLRRGAIVYRFRPPDTLRTARFRNYPANGSPPSLYRAKGCLSQSILVALDALYEMLRSRLLRDGIYRSTAFRLYWTSLTPVSPSFGTRIFTFTLITQPTPRASSNPIAQRHHFFSGPHPHFPKPPIRP